MIDALGFIDKSKRHAHTMFHPAVLIAAFSRSPLGAPISRNNYAISEFTPLEGMVQEVHLRSDPRSSVYIKVEDAKGETAGIRLSKTTARTACATTASTRKNVKVSNVVKVPVPSAYATVRPDVFSVSVTPMSTVTWHAATASRRNGTGSLVRSLAEGLIMKAGF